MQSYDRNTTYNIQNQAHSQSIKDLPTLVGTAM